MATQLATLAYRTGGDLLMTSAPAHASLAARRIVTELRHQYLLAFEANGRPGWHPLEITTRRARLTVRARAGYIAAGASAASSPSLQTTTPTRTAERQAPASFTGLTR